MAKQTNTPEDWRILAERDMDVADHLANTMAPVPTEIIAFHCQQAAEKYLKGALVILGEEPPFVCKYSFPLHNNYSIFVAAPL